MKSNTLLLIGAYGGVGRQIARLLLQKTTLDLILAGRQFEKAEALSLALNRDFPGNRTKPCALDAGDAAALHHQLQEVRMVLFAASAPEYANIVAQAALAAQCDFMDILVSEAVWNQLEPVRREIASNKRIVITQAGFHPGLPALFTRLAAPYFDQYQRAVIAMAMNAPFERAEQAVEILPLISEFNTRIFTNGDWRKAGFRDAVKTDMNHCFGKMTLYPFWLPEMRNLPERYGLQHAGVYISGFNRFVDNWVMPLMLLTQWIRKGFAQKCMLRLFVWGVNTFAPKCRGVVFLNDASGLQNGLPKQLRIKAVSNDAYLFTAQAVLACVKQYLDGYIAPGVHMMGLALDEQRFLSDMADMGCPITVEVRPLTA